jgi:hypothetical protein
LVDGAEDESQVRFGGGDGAFDESNEEVNGVRVDAGPFIFLGMKISVAYVSCEGVRLVWSGGVGIWVASVGDGWSVELVDVEDVVGANCGNGLGGAGKCNGCALVLGVGSALGASVVAGVGRSRVLGETFVLNWRCEKKLDVSGEGGFDAVMDGFFLMEDLPCWCIVDGAKMSMLRWRSSHQKGVDDAGDEEEV